MPIMFSETCTAPGILNNPTTQNPATATATGLNGISGTCAARLSGFERLSKRLAARRTGF